MAICSFMKQEAQGDFSFQLANQAKSKRVVMTKLPFARPGEKAWFKLSVQFALIIAVVSLAAFKLRLNPPLITYFKRD
jgi:hypothetical protein